MRQAHSALPFNSCYISPVNWPRLVVFRSGVTESFPSMILKGTPMIARTLATIAVAAALASPLSAVAEAFNAKPGAWEITVTTTTTGIPISPGALAEMPAEKRAQLEKTLKEQDGKPIVNSYKTCITQDELDQNHFINSKDNAQCTKKVLAKSPTKLVLEQTCPPPRGSTGTATIEARNPESLTTVIDTTPSGASGKAHVDIKGKWLGASCEGIGRE